MVSEKPGMVGDGPHFRACVNSVGTAAGCGGESRRSYRIRSCGGAASRRSRARRTRRRRARLAPGRSTSDGSIAGTGPSRPGLPRSSRADRFGHSTREQRAHAPCVMRAGLSRCASLPALRTASALGLRSLARANPCRAPRPPAYWSALARTRRDRTHICARTGPYWRRGFTPIWAYAPHALAAAACAAPTLAGEARRCLRRTSSTGPTRRRPPNPCRTGGGRSLQKSPASWCAD